MTMKLKTKTAKTTSRDARSAQVVQTRVSSMPNRAERYERAKIVIKSFDGAMKRLADK